MYMGTDFLSCFCRPEDANDGHLRRINALRRAIVAKQWRIKVRGCTLVMVYIVQTDSKDVH